MNALARTDNIFIQSLPSEVILYDGNSHRAHCVNETVFKVWQNADGSKSVDELAKLMSRDLNATCSREIVLLALEDLRTANLLQDVAAPKNVELPSRRDIARKLSIGGLSLSLLPFIASMVVPTPAMARSGNYSQATYEQEYQEVLSEANKDLLELAANKNGSETDLQTAISDGVAGIEASAIGNQTAAQTDFANAEKEFNAMLSALGLPPL